VTTTVAEGLAAYATDADLRAAKTRMGAAMPDDGWLYEYLRAVTPLTDAPVEFHLVSGLCALAGVVGNGMWAESWGQKVYPHLWAVLVAPSSFWRKSTSINLAEALLREASPTSVYPSDFSREKFLAILAENPAGMLTQKEFGGFLATLGRDYMGGMKENLTELYDGPDLFVRSLKADKVEIRRPAITLLGATTLDWLESRITEGDLQGGFLARFLFITAAEKASAKGLTTAMDILVAMRLRDALHEIHERVGGAVSYTPAARELLDDWIHSWEDEVTRTRHRSDLSGFAVRLQTYVLKFAMLYRVSATAFAEEPGAQLLDERSVAQAIAYCRVLWSNVAILIDDDIAVTKDAKELRRIRRIIGDGITRSDALKLSKLKARDFDQYLDALVQGGEVTNVRRRASEVGIDRARDSQVMWLSPMSRNGHADPSSSLDVLSSSPTAVHPEPQGNASEAEETGNSSEIEGSELSTESSSTSTSPSLSISDESARTRGGGRAREGKSKPKLDATVEDQATADDMSWL
jgi:hypothetical protein